MGSLLLPIHFLLISHQLLSLGKRQPSVTRRNPDQRYPASEYTPQGDGSGGLPDWTSKDQDLVGKELSIWHAFGVCHIPRVEDLPVMPCEVTGFML